MKRLAEVLSLFFFFIVLVFGLSEFTKGFLLTRYEITNKSFLNRMQPPPQFSKVIVLLVDALRYDFVFPSEKAWAYSNKMTVLYETSQSSPSNSVLVEFVSDPPTVTMQRIKGITTGSLPTFIDFKDNLQSDKIQEDNLLLQMRLANKKSLFVGDMIWLSLLPDGFTEAYPYDSHNVRDLDTVDNGVKEYFRREISKDWDLIVGHMLGIDHVGHRYHANHPQMAKKLLEVDEFIREIMQTIDDKALLIVFGDHGMTEEGNHGGETINEKNSILFAYSKQEFKNTKYERKAIPQIDIVPTLSVLLGIGIPYNNLGSVIPEFISNSSILEKCVFINAQQISRYLNTYDTVVKKLPDTVYEALQTNFLLLEKSFEENNFSVEEGMKYINSAGNMCRDIWTTFDYKSMQKGAAIAVMITVAVTILSLMPVKVEVSKSDLVVVFSLVFLEPVIACLYIILLVCKAVTNWALTEEFYIVILANTLNGYSLFSNSYILKQDQTLRFVLQCILANCFRKNQSFSLLICSLCIRISASVDLSVATSEINNGNVFYTSIILSVLPMLVFFYYGSTLSKCLVILILGYWHIEVFAIQLLPKMIYTIALIFAVFQKNIYESVFLILVLLSGQNSPVIFLCGLGQIVAARQAIQGEMVFGTFIGMTALQYFYTTGHKCNIQSLIISSAFIGFDEYNYYISGILLTLNTLGPLFLIFWTDYAKESVDSVKAIMLFFLVSITCTTVNAFVNNRHLMVWSIFAPKFIFDAVFFLVVWIVGFIIILKKR